MKYVLLLLLFSSCAFAKEPTTKEWTIFLWQNGDNNLCPDAKKDLAELQSLDVSANANIIVAFDCDQMNDSKLLEIKGKQIVTLDSGSEYDMGDYKLLSKNANMVFEKYPSTKRMVIIWNHGSGWRDNSKSGMHKGISYDDQSGNHITTEQLGLAMEDITSHYSIDILGFDACLMQMIEVGYEVYSRTGSKVDYMLGAEETEPAEGWDYTAFVKSLAKKPLPVAFAKDIIDGFSAYYGTEKVSLSLIRLSLPSIGELTKQMALIKDRTMFSRATGFYYRDYKDIGNAISLMSESEQKANLSKAYNNTVVYSKSTIYGASGLSVYYSTKPEKAYFNLKFALDTGWLK